MFLDKVTIEILGGHGGRGCVSWRREKYVPKGGPNGGDGGNGGNVYLIADANTDTLSDFAARKKFEAGKGEHGMGKNCHGKNGEDLYLKVPPGTVAREVRKPVGEEYSSPTGFLLADLQNPGDQLLVAHGGRGGYGNAHFKSSTRQRPDFAELGEPGERKILKLELKLVADVGIIGLPNVGKSTLISVISAARPKIADYPFTTLVPNLGVVHVALRGSQRVMLAPQGDKRSFVICDIPGLIEGASEGKGLGHEFLRHIERCGVLLHILDLGRALEFGKVNVQTLIKDYRTIRKELKTYSPTLAAKKELVILNKIDLLPEQETKNGNPTVRFKEVQQKLRKHRIPLCMTISAATTKGTKELATKLIPLVLEERRTLCRGGIFLPYKEEELPVIKPHLSSNKMGAYRIEKSGKAIIVHGKRLEQFTVMTDFSSLGGVARFQDVLERIGLSTALKNSQGKGKGELPIFIGSTRVDPYL